MSEKHLHKMLIATVLTVADICNQPSFPFNICPSAEKMNKENVFIQNGILLSFKDE